MCVCFLTLGWTALSHSIFGLDSPQPFKIVALRSGLVRVDLSCLGWTALKASKQGCMFTLGLDSPDKFNRRVIPHGWAGQP